MPYSFQLNIKSTYIRRMLCPTKFLINMLAHNPTGIFCVSGETEAVVIVVGEYLRKCWNWGLQRLCASAVTCSWPEQPSSEELQPLALSPSSPFSLGQDTQANSFLNPLHLIDPLYSDQLLLLQVKIAFKMATDLWWVPDRALFIRQLSFCGDKRQASTSWHCDRWSSYLRVLHVSKLTKCLLQPRLCCKSSEGRVPASICSLRHKSTSKLPLIHGGSPTSRYKDNKLTIVC